MQLRSLIERYPNDPVEIHGVILDYLGRTGESLPDVLNLNHKLYEQFFLKDGGKAGQHILSNIITADVDAQRLTEACRDRFPVVSQLIAGLKPNPSAHFSIQSEDLVNDPGSVLGHPVKAIVWQLSDLHFGKFNTLENNPRELAYQLATIPATYSHLAPNIVIISGDVTSKAAPKEFADFCSFCQHLSSALWGGDYPERILVVPGNHDVSWGKDGKADRMKGFAAHVANKGICITPFERSFNLGGNVNLTFCNPAPDIVPPYAQVAFVDYGIEFLLLVSGYYSGEVPQKVRSLIRSTHVRSALENLLRVDEGAVTQEYLFYLAKLPKCDLPLRMAVMHHNPIQYGRETCPNKFAPQLLDTLYQVGVPILLHGHVHLIEHDPQRPLHAGSTYPLPCTSLCSECFSGGRGLMIHFIGNDGATVDTFPWEMSQTGAFKSDGIKIPYRLHI
jgi:hypothetical protein